MNNKLVSSINFITASSLPIFCLMALVILNALPASADDWKFKITPYAWLAGVDGDLAAGERSVTFDQSFSDILSNTDFGIMGRFEASKDRFILTADLLYLDLGAEADVRSSDITADIKEKIFEFGAGYRFVDAPIGDSAYPKLSVDALAGARYFDLDLEMQGPFGRDPGTNITYWEPFIGPRAILAFSDTWSTAVRADFGGFGWGNASDFTWQLVAGVSYQATKLLSIELGYKLLDVDLERKNAALDDRTSGLILGLGFSF